MTANSSSYSTHVELYLVLNNRQLELGQVGSDHCTLRHPENLPPSRAEIVTIVDGDETRIPVLLPTGASASSRRIPYQSLASMPGSVTLLTSEMPPVTEAFQQQ